MICGLPAGRSATAAIPRQVIDDLLVHGNAATCRRNVQDYVDAGVTIPVINVITTSPDPNERARQSVEMLRALAPR